MQDLGVKNITLEFVACEPTANNVYTMTLTSPAELNGDHIVTIYFDQQGSIEELYGSWYYQVGLVQIPFTRSQSFYFTAANESYTLVCKISRTIAERVESGELVLGALRYTVSAIYAPQWATGEGLIQPTPNFDVSPCGDGIHFVPICASGVMGNTSRYAISDTPPAGAVFPDARLQVTMYYWVTNPPIGPPTHTQTTYLQPDRTICFWRNTDVPPETYKPGTHVAMFTGLNRQDVTIDRIESGAAWDGSIKIWDGPNGTVAVIDAKNIPDSQAGDPITSVSGCAPPEAYSAAIGYPANAASNASSTARYSAGAPSCIHNIILTDTNAIKTISDTVTPSVTPVYGWHELEFSVTVEYSNNGPGGSCTFTCTITKTPCNNSLTLTGTQSVSVATAEYVTSDPMTPTVTDNLTRDVASVLNGLLKIRLNPNFVSSQDYGVVACLTERSLDKSVQLHCYLSIVPG